MMQLPPQQSREAASKAPRLDLLACLPIGRKDRDWAKRAVAPMLLEVAVRPMSFAGSTFAGQRPGRRCGSVQRRSLAPLAEPLRAVLVPMTGATEELMVV